MPAQIFLRSYIRGSWLVSFEAGVKCASIFLNIEKSLRVID